MAGRFVGLGVVDLQGSIVFGRKPCDSGGHEAPPAPAGTGRSAAAAAGRHDRRATRTGAVGGADRLGLVRAGMGRLLPRR